MFMSTANISWVDGMQFVAESGSGHAIVLDSSRENGGHDSGQPVQDLKIFATAEQAPETPHYFTKIHLEYVAYGNVAEDALARAIFLSEDRYCSASATLKGKAEITSSYRVEKAQANEPTASAA
jgi:putative redox protein